MRAARDRSSAASGSLGWGALCSLVLGTILNPLNSSMVSVALVLFARDFGVGMGTVTWVVSGFYLAAAVAQPLMGRFADRFGPRRIFALGMALVLVTGALAPFAPGFGVLVVLRVVQAIGTSVAYPCAMAVLRRHSTEQANSTEQADSTEQGGRGRGPALIAAANTLSAAVGPVLGGGLVLVFGWEGVFWVNVPLALLAAGLSRLFVPADPAVQRVSAGELLRGSDPLGVLGFAAAIVGFLVFTLSLSGQPSWWALPVLVAGAGLFAWWERRAAAPFVDLRMLSARPALLATYVQFVAFNLVFYCAFYGLPEWLEDARGFTASTAGLLVLPLAGVGAVATMLGSRVIARLGVRRTLLLGFALLTLGCGGMFALSGSAAVAVIVAVGAVLGVPYGLNNLSLQARMYAASPPESSGVAAGLFQTARYVGAIGSTSVLGILFAAHIGDAQLHDAAWVMVVLAVALTAGSVFGMRRAGTQR